MHLCRAAVRRAIQAASAVLSVNLATHSDVIREHRTGHTFELHRPLEVDEGVREAHLVGCNVRCMLGWCRVAFARAYAFGLYLDDDAIRAVRKDRTATLAIGDNGVSSPSSSLLARLLDAKQKSPTEFTIAVVLVMARDISGEHLAHGFRNSVINRLKGAASQPCSADAVARSAAYASGRAGASSAPVPELVPHPPAAATGGGPLAEAHALASAFDGRSFCVGDEVLLVWGRDGSVRVGVRHLPASPLQSIGGVEEPPLEPLAVASDPRVVRALFDVYCGDTGPVSARAWATFNANLRDIAGAAGGAAPDAATIEGIVKAEHSSRTK